MTALGMGSVALDSGQLSASPRSPRSPAAPAVALPHNLRYFGVMQAAASMLGHPYRWGGESPGGFDCSGLVRWSFSASGRSLPHSSGAQRAATTPIPADQAVASDLVFFGSPVHHVGIYMGDGLMVHSPRSGDVVKIASIHTMGSAPHFGRVK
jgi:cell wall-associated NlpC family hydrolase